MTDTTDLLKTPLHALHTELGARMVPFAGYSMPVQYPAGLMAEHLHTRTAAGLFDVSHMGQLRLSGPDAAAAFESLMPVDVIGLAPGKQRYGLLLNDDGGIIDDLMFVNTGDDLFVIVNGACKHGDLAHIVERIGSRCTVTPQFDRGLLALQGPQAVNALQRLLPGVEKLVFMTGAAFSWQGRPVFATRSGYTGEDGFEMEGESPLEAISRSPENLVSQLRNRNHQYPDGAVLFLGTMFAPVKDRRGAGLGFTHEVGDRVEIFTPKLGRLVNWVDRTDACPEWTFGVRSLMRNLAERGLLEKV